MRFTLKDWAERYLTQAPTNDWVVVPAKFGIVIHWKRFYEKTPSREKLSELWDEFFREHGDNPPPPWGLGIVLGSLNRNEKPQLLVVDVDDAKQFYSRGLQIHFKNFPTVRTRRGLHFYMQDDPVFEGIRVLKLADVTVEIKRGPCIVPLPSSPHRKEPSFRYYWKLSPWDVREIPPPPAVLIGLANGYRSKKQVEKTLRDDPFPHKRANKPQSGRGRKDRKETVLNILEQLGAEYRFTEVAGSLAVRLRRCLFCGQNDSSPWIWLESGRYCCFGAKCEAHYVPKEWGNGPQGLSFYEWISKLGLEVEE